MYANGYSATKNGDVSSSTSMPGRSKLQKELFVIAQLGYRKGNPELSCIRIVSNFRFSGDVSLADVRTPENFGV